jgi:2'-5' RNA ligase
MKVIHIQLQDFGHFSNRVLYIRVKHNEDLNYIQQETKNHFLQKTGHIMKNQISPFVPHITIANRDLKPSDFMKAWDHFSQITFDEGFKTDQISLLKLSEIKWNVIASSNKQII